MLSRLKRGSPIESVLSPGELQVWCVAILRGPGSLSAVSLGSSAALVAPATGSNGPRAQRTSSDVSGSLDDASPGGTSINSAACKRPAKSKRPR